MENALVALSNELAGAVERAGRSVVAVHARRRISASGVHWRAGVVITADHAIKREEEIAVTLPDGRSLAATLAGRDPGTDLAVLKVEGAGAPDAGFGTAEDLKSGSVVLAVGRSGETGLNATMGVISAVAGSWRTWRGGLIDRFIRLDVSFYPGSSGGAVVDAQGRVLGIMTSGLSRIAPVAIPASTVDRVADALLSSGYIPRGYFGVGLHPVALPEALVKQLDLPGAGGVIVLSVEPDGPAGRAGVLIGDILVALDGKPARDTDDVQSFLETGAIGKPVQAAIVRGGSRVELAITVGERPRSG